ncbi:Abortive infection protein [Tepidanaerobacter acetatoxydans Re1]|uniref:Abortive infection protein n=1 Tax=Tepidanaerobacter acetatoxydans (strain DSM 21804 / JCM 16047 / Re1) TaxID=1209989 RepID=F4LXG8_TEPAE|nr:CPBP family intramembrane glutamic endopeptidase [Tepidanaerobacter acetatoxydans]AEE91070.1 Abortive infection protein [Tepidanaerobacter acetatoxydans Re1]CCP25698.1 Abortive infection protein [Tepidanaerobacter acetatoxydans Re1]
MVGTLKDEKLNLGVLIALFFLRFALVFLSNANTIYSNRGLVIYLLGTFILTGFFICKNIQTLSKYNISGLAIFIFLFSPIFSVIGDPYNFVAYINIPIAIAFGIYLFRKRNEIVLTKTQTNKITINIAITLIITVVIITIGVFIRGFKGGSNLDPLNLEWIIHQFLFQLSFAAIMEEPLFRGFFWGYLKKYKLSDITICVIQALLFWGVHIYYIDTGLNFWIFHPITAFLIGVIIVKTKNIAYSLVAHALINTISQIFMFYYKIF